MTFAVDWALKTNYLYIYILLMVMPRRTNMDMTQDLPLLWQMIFLLIKGSLLLVYPREVQDGHQTMDSRWRSVAKDCKHNQSCNYLVIIMSLW